MGSASYYYYCYCYYCYYYTTQPVMSFPIQGRTLNAPKEMIS